MSQITLDVPYIDDPIEIGHGGNAVVFRAIDRQLDQPVAVKMLTYRPDDTSLKAFDRERQVLARLSTHPNVVTLHRTGITTNGTPYLVMEYAPRGSLADRVRRDGPMPWEEAVEVLLPICDAVEYAHSEGIRHRDIKPENILMSKHRVPLLSDFGIAGLADGTQTHTQSAKLSLPYASPEQVDGRRLDDSTDVYSLGATLHALISGTPPFRSDGETSMLVLARRVLEERPATLNGNVPVDISRAISAAMAKDPANRPSIADFRRALARQRGVAAPPTDDYLPGLTRDVPGQPAAGVFHDPAGSRQFRSSGGLAVDGRKALLAGAFVVTMLAAGLLLSRLSVGNGSGEGQDVAAPTAEPPTTSVVQTDNGVAVGEEATSDVANTDSDGDGVVDSVDNCAEVSNLDQTDTDSDGIGDSCDPDDDNDDQPDAIDNCPAVANSDQVDVDSDSLGDACDDFPDVDADGVVDTNDPCIELPDDTDTDGDGTPDKCDASPNGMVAIAASAQITRVTVENLDPNDSDSPDLFGDIEFNDNVKTDLPRIPDQSDINPGNWITQVLTLNPGDPLLRVRVWLRDEDSDEGLFARDTLVDLSPNAETERLYFLVDTASAEMFRSDSGWNRLEQIGTLTGPDDGNLSGSITSRGINDGLHLASIDVTVTLFREAVG